MENQANPTVDTDTPATPVAPSVATSSPATEPTKQSEPTIDLAVIQSLQAQIKGLQEAIASVSSEFSNRSQESQNAINSQLKKILLAQHSVPDEFAPVTEGMTLEQLSSWLASDNYKQLSEKLQRASEPPKPQHTEPPTGSPPPAGDKPPAPKATKFSEITDDVFARIGAKLL